MDPGVIGYVNMGRYPPSVPSATSAETVKNTLSSGYNITVSNLTTKSGVISVDFNATMNGTLVVTLPESEIQNATISDILSSKVNINGVSYTDFSITVTSNGSALLTVYNLSGDPTLYRKHSPAAVLPYYYAVTFTENGIASGSSWTVKFDGQSLSSTFSAITFRVLNGTYSFTGYNTTDYYLSVYSGSVTVNGGAVSEALVFNHYSYITGSVSPGNAKLYINGKLVAISGGSFNVTLTAGNYTVVATSPGYGTYNKTFSISTDHTEILDITLNKSTPNSGPIDLVIIAVLAAIVVASAFIVLKRRNKR